MCPMGCLGINPFTCQMGNKAPSTLPPCSVPLPTWRGAFKKHKGTCKPGPALGSLGSPSTPLLLWGAGRMLRQHHRPWAMSSWAELGSSGSPGYGPSPRPQLPSFLSARHLVLVPSKRMRLGSLPLPVIKASPAQLTPKRPPLAAAASRRLPCPPLPAIEGWAGALGHQAQRTQGFHDLCPFPAPWVTGEAREDDPQSNSLQLAEEEARRGSQR